MSLGGGEVRLVGTVDGFSGTSCRENIVLNQFRSQMALVPGSKIRLAADRPAAPVAGCQTETVVPGLV